MMDSSLSISTLKNALDISSLALSIGLLFTTKKHRIPHTLGLLARCVLAFFAVRLGALFWNRLLFGLDEASNYTLSDWQFDASVITETLAYVLYIVVSLATSLWALLISSKIPFLLKILSFAVIIFGIGFSIKIDWRSSFGNVYSLTHFGR